MKPERNSPGGRATEALPIPFPLSEPQIEAVSELVQGGMRGMAEVIVKQVEAQNSRISACEVKQAANEQLLETVMSDMNQTNSDAIESA